MFLKLTHIICTKQAAWNYYDNQKNTSTTFTKEEREVWNDEHKNKKKDTK